jgi:lysophospholipase L1-like esterase
MKLARSRRYVLLFVVGLFVIVGPSCSRWDRIEQAIRSHARQVGAPESVMKFPSSAEMPGGGVFRQNAWFRVTWLRQRLIVWENRKTDQGAIIFAGDSVFEGWTNLVNSLPFFHVANRGISGDTTRGLLYRLNDDILDLHPRSVVLLCGINDLSEGDSPESVVQNFQEILARCRIRDAQLPVIICTVLPVVGTNSTLNLKTRELNEKLRALTNTRVVIANTWSALADQNGAALPEQYLDSLHPNAGGYRKLLGVLEPLLRESSVGSPR